MRPRPWSQKNRAEEEGRSNAKTWCAIVWAVSVNDPAVSICFQNANTRRE
jgi:hypothetical protein